MGQQLVNQFRLEEDPFWRVEEDLQQALLFIAQPGDLSLQANCASQTVKFYIPESLEIAGSGILTPQNRPATSLQFKKKSNGFVI